MDVKEVLLRTVKVVTLNVNHAITMIPALLVLPIGKCKIIVNVLQGIMKIQIKYANVILNINEFIFKLKGKILNRMSLKL